MEKLSNFWHVDRTTTTSSYPDGWTKWWRLELVHHRLTYIDRRWTDQFVHFFRPDRSDRFSRCFPEKKLVTRASLNPEETNPKKEETWSKCFCDSWTRLKVQYRPWLAYVLWFCSWAQRNVWTLPDLITKRAENGPKRTQIAARLPFHARALATSSIVPSLSVDHTSLIVHNHHGKSSAADVTCRINFTGSIKLSLLAYRSRLKCYWLGQCSNIITRPGPCFSESESRVHVHTVSLVI